MKKLIMIFVVAVLSFAINAQTAVFTGNASSITSNVDDGMFEIEMPASVNKDASDKVVGYYSDYFTVNYNETSNVVKIDMVDNSSLGRRVITRYLLSLGIKSVELDGEKYTINDFYSTYLN